MSSGSIFDSGFRLANIMAVWLLVIQCFVPGGTEWNNTMRQQPFLQLLKQRRQTNRRGSHTKRQETYVSCLLV